MVAPTFHERDSPVSCIDAAALDTVRPAAWRSHTHEALEGKGEWFQRSHVNCRFSPPDRGKARNKSMFSID
jgi:hypothetical protein